MLSKFGVLAPIFIPMFMIVGMSPSLISLMVPYSLALGIVWTLLLVAWYFTGLPLGPSAPLSYAPGS